MADPRSAPKFGELDLEIEEATGAAFGELDWDPPEDSDPSLAPESSSRPSEHMRQALAAEREEEAPPSSKHSGQHGAPSASAVSAKDDRVALMRELYARGDAAAALEIAAAVSAATGPPPPLGDSPDASIFLEYGEAEIDVAAFGGLVPVDDEVPIEAEDPVHERDMTRIAKSASLPPASMLTSLTERQGIPRVLKGPADIAKLPIDHRAGFLLGFIDGMHTMEEILDVCAMPPAEALELIRSLVDMGVIEIE